MTPPFPPVRSVYQLLAYYVTLLLFGLGGLELSLLSLLLGWLPATPRTERFFQRLIHRHFAACRWCWARARLVTIRYHGFERLPPGVVLVANHPALIDIVCLLARIPEAICIFKPAIRRNPILGAAARRAGYLGSDGGHDLVRSGAEKVAGGHRLIVFPEGTRTPPGQPLLPFKPGFVLIAQRARAPIQLVRITTDSDVLTKGRTWWRLPKFPAHIDVRLGPLLPAPAIGVRPKVLTEQIETWFRAAGDPACASDARSIS